LRPGGAPPRTRPPPPLSRGEAHRARGAPSLRGPLSRWSLSSHSFLAAHGPGGPCIGSGRLGCSPSAQRRRSPKWVGGWPLSPAHRGGPRGEARSFAMDPPSPSAHRGCPRSKAHKARGAPPRYENPQAVGHFLSIAPEVYRLGGPVSARDDSAGRGEPPVEPQGVPEAKPTGQEGHPRYEDP
jgi:hypothetical protein